MPDISTRSSGKLEVLKVASVIVSKKVMELDKCTKAVGSKS